VEDAAPTNSVAAIWPIRQLLMDKGSWRRRTEKVRPIAPIAMRRVNRQAEQHCAQQPCKPSPRCGGRIHVTQDKSHWGMLHFRRMSLSTKRLPSPGSTNGRMIRAPSECDLSTPARWFRGRPETLTIMNCGKSFCSDGRPTWIIVNEKNPQQGSRGRNSRRRRPPELLYT
jgi:hypothetical protein